jgi:neutral ceramidase
MTNTLYAGAARKIINPPLGIKRPGIRLFADPIQAIETDLTATALILSNDTNKAVIMACDLLFIPLAVTLNIRRRISAAVGTPISHVMINFSHTHSGPTLPDFLEDSPEQMRLQHAYQDQLIGWLVEAATQANQQLQPARIGADWGEAHIGVYRRETGSDGKDVLGEDPKVPIDNAVGVIRVDNLEGQAIATLFSYGCHTVTMGPRSMVSSSDFPGPARELVEDAFGGLAIYLQACGGNVNPIHGIGYEVNCRDTKNRTGLMLGGEVIRVAANIRTNVRRGEQRKPMGVIPKILFWPWEPVEDNTSIYLGAADEIVKLEFIELPSLAEAEAIHQQWQQKLAGARANDAPDWEVSVAMRFCDWSANLVKAVQQGNPPLDTVIQAIRINDIVLASISIEAFFETGLAIKAKSPFAHTQVLGYTNGCESYLPRAEDYPAGGWKVTERYAVPDLFFQCYSLPVALRPETEQKMVERVSDLIQQLA